jgi:inosine/xanthosine triphosphatase
VSVESGVSDQPLSDKESMEGANNRVNNAKKSFKSGDYWVGIEAGVEKTKKGMASFSWVVIKSKDKEGKAKGNIFFLPKKVAELVEEGKELGEADDIVFNDSNSKQKNGSVGILTHDLIDRTDYYYVALVLALIPFRNQNLY